MRFFFFAPFIPDFVHFSFAWNICFDVWHCAVTNASQFNAAATTLTAIGSAFVFGKHNAMNVSKRLDGLAFNCLMCLRNSVAFKLNFSTKK